jgi:hypothetical protein
VGDGLGQRQRPQVLPGPRGLVSGGGDRRSGAEPRGAARTHPGDRARCAEPRARELVERERQSDLGLARRGGGARGDRRAARTARQSGQHRAAAAPGARCIAGGPRVLEHAHRARTQHLLRHHAQVRHRARHRLLVPAAARDALVDRLQRRVRCVPAGDLRRGPRGRCRSAAGLPRDGRCAHGSGGLRAGPAGLARPGRTRHGRGTRTQLHRPPPGGRRSPSPFCGWG